MTGAISTEVDPRFYAEILPRLWRAGAFGYFWSNDDGDGRKVTLWHDLAAVPAPQLPRSWWKLNAYFGVHPTRKRGESSWARAKIADIALINCLYAEVDGLSGPADVEQWLDWLRNDCSVRPALIVFSGGGLHIYWLLDEPFVLDDGLALERATVLQKAIVASVGGDTSVHDLARVLRIPGTVNWKPERNEARVEILYWQPENVYTIDEMEQALAEQVKMIRGAREAHATPISDSLGLDDARVIRVLLGARHGETYRQLWAGDMSSADGDHSKADARLLAGLAWATGCDREQMDRLFRQSGLMRPKWERESYRTASLDAAIGTTKTVYSPAKGRDDAAIAAAQAVLSGQGAAAAVSLNGSSPTPDDGGADDTPPDSAAGPASPSAPKPPPRRPLHQYTANDEGNAQAFLAHYGGSYCYCAAYGWMTWDGRCWRLEGGESALQRAIVGVLEQRHLDAQQSGQQLVAASSRPSAANVRACQFLLTSLLEVSVGAFDASPDHLNCWNGVVDLRSGALEAHTPAQRYTYCLPVEYDPHADYVPWVEFLHSVVSEPAMVDYLQIALGYSTTGHTAEECLFAIVGATRSGKGTLTETILKLLPKPLGVEIDFSTFTAKRDVDSQNFDLAALKPARFVAASESKHNETLNEAKVKLATGGNYIRAAFKHKDFFEYRPQFKIWLTSNHPIRGDVSDEAFWGRIRVLEFPHSFLGREDKTLKRRMQAPDNLRGVLNWLVQGAMRWYASPTGLAIPDAVRRKTDAVRREFDHVGQWLDECCDLTDGAAWTSNVDLWASYTHWATRLGMNKRGIFNAVHLARSLAAKGFDVGQRRWVYDGVNKVQARGALGIKLR